MKGKEENNENGKGGKKWEGKKTKKRENGDNNIEKTQREYEKKMIKNNCGQKENMK